MVVGYFDTTAPNWKKHKCTSKPVPYTPFNKKGQPKLRNRRSEFERNHWLPLIGAESEKLASGTLVRGVALDVPTDRYFGFASCFEIEVQVPIYFRVSGDAKSRMQLSFFPVGGDEPQLVLGYDDCRNAMELIEKLQR
jgi:hypothetical protein